jgi:NAD(P)H-hydrate repair Nnr-like enzyme with NAD(P)H-hydrate epimerase domain
MVSFVRCGLGDEGGEGAAGAEHIQKRKAIIIEPPTKHEWSRKKNDKALKR